ncbi:GntR family transcriptional regulator [Actinopolymorpha alba]|uniref:GntR family transcriptional regulator n=1 Tax=Actinopolymorpha alba TaxID=533267 RepID=UPI0003608990|nr:GntR family transcriptional regulator [Actinopolymorpha alba]
MTAADVPNLGLQSLGHRQSLREQVIEALRASLVAGEMRPGVLYSAPTIAAQIGVSATPVREAMQDLVKEGLVEAVRNKGFRVTELSEQDLDDITGLRALIEIPTIVRIAGDCDVEAIEAFRPHAAAIVDAARRGDLIGYVEADRRLHLGLLALAGNRHLVDTVDGLRARTRLYGLQALVETGDLVASAEEHHELLDLLAAHDIDGVTALMHCHLGHVRGSWAGIPERRTP